MKNLKLAATLILAGMVVSALAAAYAQETATSRMDPTAPLTPAMAAQLSQSVNRPVIVLMKNQLIGASAESDQAPMMSELSQVKAKHIKPYRLVNSFAAMVSDGEVARLKANPAVAQVIPDVVLHLAPHAWNAASSAQSSTRAVKVKANTSLTPNVIPGACGTGGAVLLEPEALQTTNTDSIIPAALTAHSLGITGAGVKVAYIADGVDPNNINFIRANNTSAFVDYQDFSGDGPGNQTDGGEAFIDSNAIAGQGIRVYNVNGFSDQADPGACNIRIEGVAPGAALVGLDVFSYAGGSTTESNILQAIDYAVMTDHVDVLNESFGSNPFPDVTAADATKIFNDAAVAAGTTVTVSSGDAGTTNTIGSPASDPNVIGVGASTTLRFYAQTNYGAARYFASAGWLDDNISALSSAGFSETGATVDLVAPGDLGWASCDANSDYFGCTNFVGQPTATEESGGTSMAAPLTAGAAALVIQAYRNTHHGHSPTPALVKQILTSTATDLGVPATEQGAGLLNSYKAVLLAETIKTSDGSPLPGGPSLSASSLILSVNQLNAVGAPGTPEKWPVTVTNNSAVAQFVQISGRTFGPLQNVQTGSVTLNDSTSPQFLNYQGLSNNYATFTFHVAPGVARLNASIAYPGSPSNGSNARARLSLIDPQGRFAAHSIPQGVGNFGNADVREPAPGTWTGVIFCDVASRGGTNGVIPWQVSTQQFVPFGSISNPLLFLFPGQSQTISVTASTPSSPGDAAGSIILTSSAGGMDSYLGFESNSIPVTLRSLVNLANGGAFSGVLTGGNGRISNVGQVDYYQFNVGPGHTSITANVSLSNDIGDTVNAYLISPDGVGRGYAQNSVNGGSNSLSLTAYVLNPPVGSWTLIVDFGQPVVGDEVSQPFTGNIKLDNVTATATGLPNSASIQLPAGTPVTIPVSITNNGAGPGAFFIDARLNTTTSLPLASLASQPYQLPNTALLPWLVPTQTSSVQVAASATLPVEFDFAPFTGDPDVFGAPTTTDNAAGSYTPSGGTVQPTLWYVSPDEIGPYPGPAPSGTVDISVTATTKAFDPAVTSDSGDVWTASISGNAIVTPMTVNPGGTGVIMVTITPSGSSGTVVSGTLYLNDFFNLSGTQPADEVAAFPYTYSIR